MKKLISLVLVVVMFVSSTNMANVFKVMADEIVITEEDEAIEYVCNPEDYTYSVENEEVTVTKYNGSDEAVKIPDTFEGYPVTKIGKKAFAKNSVLVNILLPDTLTVIKEGAFSYCTGLTDIVLPDNVTTLQCSANYDSYGNPYYSDGVFESCSALRKVTLSNNLQRIPQVTFRNCSNLESIVFPEVLVGIGESAFQGCSSLQQIEIPASLKSVGEGAFSSCSSLEEVHIPSLEMWFQISFDCDYYFWSLGSVYSYRSGANPLVNGAKLYADGELVTEVTVPEKISKIPQYIFDGYAYLAQVYIPDSVTKIEKGAFNNCKGLIHVEIPDSVNIAYKNSSYGERASFEGCSNAVFYCNRNSQTAKYALNYNIPVIDKSSAQDAENSMLIYGESNYRFNMDGITASGYLPMVIDYAFKPDADVSDMQITVNIPLKSVLIEDSVSIDNFGIDGYQYTEGQTTLVIPVEQTKGTVRFSVKPDARTSIVSSAIMKYKNGSSTVSEVIGFVYKEMPEITLSSDTTTGTADVAVSGITFAQNTVDIYLDDVYQDSVQANKAGNYSTSLTLPELVDLREYVIRAETTNEDGDVVFEENTIKYVENTPEIVSFIMEHNGQTVNMLDDSGVHPIITVGTNQPYRFIIKADKDDNLLAIKVTSTRNRVSKSIMAKWDVVEEAYIAEGYFDDEDASYVPGSITVSTTSGAAGIGSTIDNIFQIQRRATDSCLMTEINDELQTNFNEELSKVGMTCSAEISESSPTVLKGYISFYDNNEQTSEPVKMEYSCEKDVYMGMPADAIEDGFKYLCKDDGNLIFYKSEGTISSDQGTNSGSLTMLSIAKTGADSFITDLRFGFLGEVASESGKKILNTMSTTYTSLSVLSDVIGINTDTDALIEKVEKNTALSASITQQTIAELNALRMAQIMFVGSGALIGAGAGALLIALLGLTALPAILVGATVGAGVAMITSFMVSLPKDTQQTIVNQKFSGNASFRPPVQPVYTIDPSGYIYDNTTNERIPGATVTCYCVEYDGSETFWDSKPAETEYGIKWDASEWSQMNPLTTDLEGRYAWDVPEGWWRVKVEKEGYETVWSEWLPVPPPQTEVYLGMTPLTAALGDINQDGSVDENDVEILNRYFAGWPGYEQMIPGLTVADMNGDKKLTRADAMILARQVARW